jgi:hypothetical protein
MGDRVAALETRVRNEYELDFPAAWPRLWLVIPEPSRAELRADLAESAVDLYGVDLAEHLGIDVPERQVTLDIGREITVRLRKSG